MVFLSFIVIITSATDFFQSHRAATKKPL